MTRRGVSLLVAPALAAALASGVVATQAAPSYAESISAPDPSGDPVSFDESGEDVQPAPDAASVDAVSTTIDYRRRYLVVRTEAERASASVTRRVQVLDQDTGKESFFIHRGPSGPVSPALAGCTGVSTRVDKETAVYAWRIPVRCFGTPSLVRVAVGLTIDRSTDARYTADDAQRGSYDPQDPSFAYNRALHRD